MSQLLSSAKLRSFPSSPKKMRLVADIIRNKSVGKAVSILKGCPKHAAIPLSKLLLSAFANLRVKHEDYDIDEEQVFIKIISVDDAGFFKRLRTAPQGRAHRIRKRSNHVSVTLAFDAAASEKEPASNSVKGNISAESAESEK